MALYFFEETKKKFLTYSMQNTNPFWSYSIGPGNWWFLHSYTWEKDFQSVCLSVPLLNFQTLSIKRWGKVAHGFNYLKSTLSYDACIIISQIGVLLFWRRRLLSFPLYFYVEFCIPLWASILVYGSWFKKKIKMFTLYTSVGVNIGISIDVIISFLIRFCPVFS